VASVRQNYAAPGVAEELEEVIQNVLRSHSRRKLVVAGPGTGKTTLFQRLLESAPGNQETRLVLTFINNLVNELDGRLGHLSKVSTLHRYCQWLLRSRPELRNGLSEKFVCLPGLASIIQSDWVCLRGGSPPHFVKSMRNFEDREELIFYFERADYYDAVDFDDSVYRTTQELTKKPAAICGYDLVLIDEYQDFNRTEAELIEILAKHNPIVVAGDDDQALYTQLREANWDYIRSLRNASEYEFFPLPFCMRCPEVIVQAVGDIISKARELHKLDGRIEKPYFHYEPVKGADSRLYPKIWLVTTSVQRKDANYFGQFIEETITAIPRDDITEANENCEPVVLIIGSPPYLPQVAEYLARRNYGLDAGRDRQPKLQMADALKLLKENSASNLGWRVALEIKNKKLAELCVRKTEDRTLSLYKVIPREFKESVLTEVEMWTDEDGNSSPNVADESTGLTIKLTSFEGAKGLSAQYVFILGLHAEELPRDSDNIQDLEICKLVVGLTRTKKRCALLLANQFAGKWKRPSLFISWIRSEKYERIYVDRKYWASKP